MPLQSGGIVADHASELRFSDNVFVEAFENLRERRLNDLPQFAQQFAGSGVDTHEAQPYLALLALIRDHVFRIFEGHASSLLIGAPGRALITIFG